MWNYFSEPKVMNCTFSGNSANGDGGGIYSSAGSSSAITNCIIWGNTASSGSQVDGPATVRYSCVQGGYAGQGNIAEDPLFVDPNGVDGISGTEDDNVRLASNSPCIDTGDPDYLDPYNPTDLDGRNRIIDGDCDSPATVDMGAYEFGQVYIGDFAGGCDVNLADFAVMAAAWLASDSDTEWNPHCNLYDADLVIDVFDLRIFAAHWLEGT
jgi:predicted outer membrane repeat protein